MTVHPHACGERMALPPATKHISGSSPRLWGTVTYAEVGEITDRFIPTPVGNGSPRAIGFISVTVHPHACGERGLPNSLFLGFCGSSPRLWGTDQYSCHRQWIPRFIPTPVGNGCKDLIFRCADAVHPHACGERPAASVAVAPVVGSSPRLWGTVSAARHINECRRFIPTPVGNGSSLATQSSLWAVHPHACGERALDVAHSKKIHGSSPRLWGTAYIFSMARLQ